jgi:ribosomal protein S18 acetylase RimI-like enzyme
MTLSSTTTDDFPRPFDHDVSLMLPQFVPLDLHFFPCEYISTLYSSLTNELFVSKMIRKASRPAYSLTFVLLLSFVSLRLGRGYLTTAISHRKAATSVILEPPSTKKQRALIRVSKLTATAGNNDGQLLQHKDILWKLTLPPETPRWKKLRTKISAKLLRWEFKRTGEPVPAVLVPQTARSGQVVLEAYYQKQKVGRFGFTTQPGPPLPLAPETLQALVGTSRYAQFAEYVTVMRSAALIYMWVDPSLRKRGLGPAALSLISYAHAAYGSDLTVLVADDDGSGKLVQWYEQQGFMRAAELQDILGSPNQQYGVAMVGPTNGTVPEDCVVQWW